MGYTKEWSKHQDKRKEFFKKWLKYCNSKPKTMHSFVDREWLPKHHVWIDICEKCGMKRMFTTTGNILVLISQRPPAWEVLMALPPDRRDLTEVAKELGWL